MAEAPGNDAVADVLIDPAGGSLPASPIDTSVDLDASESRRRRILADLMALLASAFVHIALIVLSLLVYLKVTEENRGPGFVAGTGGMGQPLEVQRIEGLNEDLNLENALAVDAVAQTLPAERPVMEPEVTLRQPEVRPDLVGATKSPEANVSLESLVARQWSKAALSSRTPGMKAALLKSEGGTPESEKAVARGLEWLASHQNEDGSWSLSPSTKCGHRECGSVNAESPETATALALLPFFGAGYFPGEEGPYEKTVSRALSWLQTRVDKSGRVIPDNAPRHFHMYAHAIVTIALCEATALKPDGDWAPAAQRAAQYIINAQNREDGGWRYFPGQAGDTSVYGWQIMALRSARIAGMNVPKSTMTLSRRWLTASRAATDGSLYAYQPGRYASPVMTAEALLCRQLFGDGPKSRGMARGTASVLQQATNSMSSRNYYFWYYATQLMHNTGGKTWSRWNPLVRERIISEQIVDAGAGHAIGSWQPTNPGFDMWGRTGGPIMQTSLGLLTLEVYYRYLPMYQVAPDPEKSEELPLGRSADD
ncbi:hypothetical protein GC170_18465 [bacterium]|nr:hypothetical protein [bacterium]